MSEIVKAPLLSQLAGPLQARPLAAFGPDVAKLERWLEQRAGATAATAAGGPFDEPHRLSLIRQFFGDARKGGWDPEAAYLGDVLGDALWSVPVAYRVYLRALARLNALDLLDVRTRVDPSRPPAAEAIAIQARLKSRIFSGAQEYERQWGAPAASLELFLNDRRHDGQARRQFAGLLKSLAHLREIPPSGRQDFEDRFVWGAQARVRLKFLKRFGLSQSQDRHETDAATERVFSLATEALAALAPPDIAPVMAARTHDRGILIALAHAGPLAEAAEVNTQIGLPVTQFAASAEAVSDTEGPLKVSTDQDREMVFLKAAKASKKEPRLIRIFPDGPHGATAQRLVLGVPVNIGLGAGVLGWIGRSATFFQRCEWRDGRPVTTLVPGPDAINFATREEFTEAFLDFYASELERIAAGPPENIGGMGGIWGTLANFGPKTG